MLQRTESSYTLCFVMLQRTGSSSKVYFVMLQRTGSSSKVCVVMLQCTGSSSTLCFVMLQRTGSSSKVCFMMLQCTESSCTLCLMSLQGTGSIMQCDLWGYSALEVEKCNKDEWYVIKGEMWWKHVFKNYRDESGYYYMLTFPIPCTRYLGYKHRPNTYSDLLLPWYMSMETELRVFIFHLSQFAG